MTKPRAPIGTGSKASTSLKPEPETGIPGGASRRLTSAIIADELEAEIIDGRLAPGSRLDEQANTEFRTAIFMGTHNPERIQVANALRLKLAPFRKSQLKAADRIRRSNEEHAAIVTAILDRDGRKAEKALRRHLMSAAKAVLAKMA